MTFLELATAIDVAEQRVTEAEQITNNAFNELAEFKTRQFKQLENEEAKVRKFQDDLAAEKAKLAALFSQLHDRMPIAPKSVAKPNATDAELKAIYQGGMKYRGNLG